MLSDAANYLYVVLVAGHFGILARPCSHSAYQNPFRWLHLPMQTFPPGLDNLKPGAHEVHSPPRKRAEVTGQVPTDPLEPIVWDQGGYLKTGLLVLGPGLSRDGLQAMPLGTQFPLPQQERE